jgi:muramoyltetrapeptide carboxypeptidase
LLAGSLPATRRIMITGGNLDVIVALLGSPFAGAFETQDKWLALEDVNESAGSIDRMMAALKLSGLLERVEGVILGDFRNQGTKLSETAFRILRHHLPAGRRVPIVALENLGHVYPMAPLPMHREVTLRCSGKGRGPKRVSLELPWAKWAGRNR